MAENTCCHHEMSEEELEAARKQSDADAIYICPMHPEVRQKGFGTCPICGMALEREEPGADEGPNPELVGFQRRFWIGLVFTIPLVILEMGGHVFGYNLLPWLSHYQQQWVQAALAAPVVLYAGWPILVRGTQSIWNRTLNMFTLIALGVLVAFVYSLIAVGIPSLFPETFQNEHGLIDVYFEAAAVIMVLVLLGQVLELRARSRTSQAIKALLNLTPKTAFLVYEDGEEQEVPLEKVEEGDLLRVKPGGRVPVDGVVTSGRGQVDEAMVTGEPMPQSRKEGDNVIGGTINQSGSFVMRAEAVGADSVLSRIVKLVAQAQRSRAPIQRLADKVAAWFVPAVVVVAVLAFLAWWLWGPEPSFTFGIIAAVSVLIIACPCALGLATPMSIMVGVGRAARAGVLVRDVVTMETMAHIDTLVIDKTGTLTQGHPSLTAIHDLEGDEKELLTLVASLEGSSEHPLARAVVDRAKEDGVKLKEVKDFESVSGGGVSGEVDGHKLLLGSPKFLISQDFDIEPLQQKLKEDSVETPVFVAVDGKPRAVLTFGDKIKEDAAHAVTALKSEGVEIIMATGDAEGPAQAVGRELELDGVKASMRPEEKAELVKELKRQGKSVAVAGDGINDAPALAAADVGIAMGTGTDIAMESAALTLVKGDLSAIVRARIVSRAVVRNIRQNLAFAFLYNALGVPVAAGILYPAFGLLLSPMIAALAMSLSSVSVIANALRLNAMDVDAS